MSPEELLTTVDLRSTEAFKQMDIFSMALVLWEIISRCEIAGKTALSRSHLLSDAKRLKIAVVLLKDERYVPVV